ncbi:hypothetical protein NE237_024850 [Protea cynaroides]|uniref:C2 NT-type domain-containing protein n=1 Tax=Protea cynaroides TaxID=273540 RepID=A0A9Q0JYY0_9MAGN|nr:hypothetical protein NE237_024850 [Protea cynaroides]
MRKKNILRIQDQGNKGTISTGDVQWMTVGRGIVHSEMLVSEGINMDCTFGSIWHLTTKCSDICIKLKLEISQIKRYIIAGDWLLLLSSPFQIPQTGWDKLFVSFIPADSGKATAKTTKVNIRNGTCKWSDPIYETTKLLLDPRTKEYDDKLYKLVVAMGSSQSSFLGEANINLADYADASKPCTVSLLLHGCDSGALLHVSVCGIF